MIALDLDGTLLDYSPEGPAPKINRALLTLLARQRVRSVAICTNQGGLCFGVLGSVRKDGRGYPTPPQFVARLRFAVLALAAYGISVPHVRVSCWHKAAATQPDVAAAVQRAAQLVRWELPYKLAQFDLDWRVYTTERARKPAPLMLRSVGATCYYGDSDEDAQAAANAGIQFHYVERLL